MNVEDNNFNYDRDTWEAGIDPYFEQQDILVRHQIHSFDHFLEHDIPEIIGNSSPQEIGAGWDPKTKQYSRKYRYKFGKIYISKPLVLESNESVNILLPNIARMRELTYAAPLFVDVEHEIEVINESGHVIKDSKVESKVPLAKIPIMLFSKYCYLHNAEKNNKTLGELGESEFEHGGYTIVNGSEKVIIGQERPAENKVLCFKNKSSTKYSITVEIKSTRDQRLYPIKVTTVNLTKEPIVKDSKNLDLVSGRTIKVSIYSLKIDIPLFVVFRALGIITDKDIFQFILYDVDDPDQNFVNLVMPSCEEALRVKDPDDKTKFLEIRSEEAALKYMSNPKILKYDTSFLSKQENPEEAREKYIKDLINRELFPHMGEDNRKKGYFLGYMTRRLLECFLGIRPFDDRDHYSNKRVNLAGPLYAKIFSANFTRLNRKLNADILKHLSADVAPKSVFPGFRKGIQSCSIDTSLKYALSTGNWATTKSGSSSSTNKGVAQVLQRMSAIQTLSHLRRIQSPLERTGSKLVPPRKLHATQVGFICPNETPEGAQVGVVKNLAFMAHVTTHTNPVRVFLILRELGVRSLDEISPYEMTGATKVFVNGHMYGIIPQGLTKQIYDNLKLFKKNNMGLDPYTSIRWFIEFKELLINTDGGRYSRPVYVVHNSKEHGGVPTLLLETNWNKIRPQLEDGSFDWNSLLGSEWNDTAPPKPLPGVDAKEYCNNGIDLKPENSAIIEYIDTDETEEAMIAVTHHSLLNNHAIRNVRVINKGTGYKVGDQLVFNNEGTNGQGAAGEVAKVGENGRILSIKLSSKGRDYLSMPTVAIASGTGSGAVLEVVKKNTFYNYTHCEIHPTMWFGVVSQAIPFMEHNPSPRNCFQCLWKEEEVVMGDGSLKKIKDIKIGDTVVTVDPVTCERQVSKVINQYVKNTTKNIIKLTTVSGRELICTDDHPILTTNGWKQAKTIGSTDLICISPTLLSYSLENIDLVLDSNMFESRCKNIGIKSKLIETHKRQLETLKLLPLRNNSDQLPIIARIFGFATADGSCGIYGKGPQLQLSFGSYPGGLEFLKDIHKLGYKRNKLIETEGEIHNVVHHGWTVSYSNSLSTLLMSLGLTRGKKTVQPTMDLPTWITSGSKLVKREFLSGLQGGDGAKIRHSFSNNRKSPIIMMHSLSQQKCHKHLHTLQKFFNDVKILFEEFGIICKTVKTSVYEKYDDRYTVELIFDNSRKNLINYFDRIGYRYDHHKTMDSLPLYEYQKYCQYEIEKIDKMKETIYQLKNTGKTYPAIGTILGITDVQANTLYRSYGMKTRLPNDNIDIKDWLKTTSTKNNCIFVPIKKIETHHNVEIADITVDNNWHSFITGSGIVVHNSSMQKQAIGTYATNYNNRMDTMAHVLCYPQKPLVYNRTMKYTNMDKLPQGQQLVVALACYTGYNQEDSIMVNKSAVDRGMMSVLSFKTYKDKEQKHKSVTSVNGMETFGKPDRNLTKDMRGKAEDYAAIDETGVASVGSFVRGGDIIIGKYIELRPEDKETTGKLYKDISKELKTNDDGYVDKVLNGKTGIINTNAEGERIAKVRIVQLRKVEIADKFATRAAQKGTVGMMYRQEDMPFTSGGIVPDVIFNPHGLPSRMTVGQLLENLCGKVAALKGQMMDSTPFTYFNQGEVEEILESYGFCKSCDEVMFNGFTGQQFKVPIFIGPTYYQRLKHMVADKIHSRESGPVQLMTRQPQEGRARDGGLRLGEMERDCLASHGASQFLKERLMDSSDLFRVYVSKEHKAIVVANPEKNLFLYNGKQLTRDQVTEVQLPYAMKLLLHEMIAIGIDPRLYTD